MFGVDTVFNLQEYIINLFVLYLDLFILRIGDDIVENFQ